MARLIAETAEAPAPDAAAGFGTRPGDTRQGSGRWPVATLRGVAVGGPKLRSSGCLDRQPPVEDTKGLSSRVGAEQASDIACGMPVGPAAVSCFRNASRP
jgi:hypothetical protein